MATKLEDIIHELQTGSFQDIYQNKSMILNEVINKIDKPILKGLAKDVSTVLSNWFENPKIICCLIQGLWSIYATSEMKKNIKSSNEYSLSNTEFSGFLDVLIAFIDVIIVILTDGIKKIVFMIPDILKELMYGVMGAVIIMLQQTLFSLRDSVISALIKWIDKSQAGTSTSSVWAKCLPLSQFFDVIKKYIHDYGLLTELEEKIKGYISSMYNRFAPQWKNEFNIAKINKDLEFLYWFRDLLVKMKTAATNYDLCIPFDYSVPDSNTNNINIDDSINNSISSNTDYPLTSSNLGIKVTSNGTILVDKQSINTIPLLSNSSIRGFLNKYYGYPLDIVDSLLVGATSKDSIIGTNINSQNISDLNADCPNTPSAEDIMKWALDIRNQVK